MLGTHYKHEHLNVLGRGGGEELMRHRLCTGSALVELTGEVGRLTAHPCDLGRSKAPASCARGASGVPTGQVVGNRRSWVLEERVL